MIGDKKIGKGFTLIEILIGIAIFSIVVTSFLSLFSSAFSQQQKSLNANYLLGNTSFITEYMSRALRMAQKDLLGSCLFTAGSNYESIQGGQGLRFLNYQGLCQEFYLENNIIKVAYEGSAENLTPSDLIVEELRFNLTGQGQLDSIQPKVTFALEIRTSRQPIETLNVQTTICQRELDINVIEEE